MGSCSHGGGGRGSCDVCDQEAVLNDQRQQDQRDGK
jgi:hypothetical protein